jgi:hypothetical protein
MNYEVVVGVDEKHLPQLAPMLQHWHRAQRGLFSVPWRVFYDFQGVCPKDVLEAFRKPHRPPELTIHSWPAPGIEYPPGDGTKWTDPQRHKMLAGFVYTAGTHVKAQYWLKIDLDVVSTSTGRWIQPEWFDGRPAIVASPWGYTKPAGQMAYLDAWFDRTNRLRLDPDLLDHRFTEPLRIGTPAGATLANAGSVSRDRHARIASWLGFFETEFTKQCMRAAANTVGFAKLPVASQDGFMWYMAARMGLPIKRIQMKNHGWAPKSNLRRALAAVAEMDQEQETDE